jgi:hypothetical protein
VRRIRFLLPILLVALAGFVAGNASGSEGKPTSPVSTKDWKVCLDDRTADYLTHDIAAWPGLEECFRQP